MQGVRQVLVIGIVTVVAALGGSVGTVRAGHEPFVTYEDWKTSDHISRGRWTSTVTPAQDVQVEQVGHKVRMRLRREGGTASNAGFVGAGMAMAMANPLAVDQVEATFKVKSLTLTGCTGIPGTFSSALPAELTLNKLYDGTPRLPGQRTGDHFGRIRALRLLSSTDPAGALRIQAAVFRCIDAVCSNAFGIPGGFVEFPDLVFVGDQFTLRLVWDAPNHRFLASVNEGPEVTVPYPATLVAAPGVPLSTLSMTAAGANCIAGPGVSDAEIEVREVRTNAGAVAP